MINDFQQIKLRNETTGEYVLVYGKVDRVPKTFAYVKKYNIYGQLKQSQVGILKEIALNIEYCYLDDKMKIEKWWETKSTIWIEEDNKIPLLATFVDEKLSLKEEINTEDDELYYTGTINFE